MDGVVISVPVLVHFKAITSVKVPSLNPVLAMEEVEHTANDSQADKEYIEN